jgi:glycosyltransferase involved in cell wall biosynthesis
LRICVVAKYPPIQGGISAQSYWMCRRLAERGHDVDVVTNADEVEPAYRIALGAEDDAWLAPRFAGGAVTVWRTEAPTASYRYIPQGNPVVTKLATLAAEAIDARDADVVVGFYLEPYGLAAYLAATWTGRPLVIRHAGSDVGRLLEVPQLRRCYAEILKAADVVCARPAARARFTALGVPDARLFSDPGFVIPRELFCPEAEPLKLGVDASRPAIGIYGKLGEVKGTFDLLAALSRLKREGVRFTLLAATHGSREDEDRFERLLTAGGLRDDVRVLPFLPHWRVPSFVRSCALVCVLERGFPIASHAPGTPVEVLSCGTPLVISAEVARKQLFAPRLVHGRNVMIVRDPRDHDELAAVLRDALNDPALRDVGLAGRRVLPAPAPADAMAAYESIFEAAVARGASPPPQDVPARPDDQEQSDWDALQTPHPAIARNELLDALFHRGDELAESGAGASIAELVPELAHNVVLRLFSRDMELERGASDVPHAFAFQHLPHRARNRVVRLGLGHYRVASLADGTRTVAQIAKEMRVTLPGAGDEIFAAARDLFDEGLVTLSARARAAEPPDLITAGS